jgi:aldehyde:ferredoxin oxidoreductase
MAEIGLTNPEGAQGLNEEMVRYSLVVQHNYSALDTVNVCQFVFGPAWQIYSTAQLAELVRCATGWDASVEELQKIGERRLNMMRTFNAREGFDRKDDTIPKKFLQALKGGASDGIKLTIEEVEAAKDIYYKLAGWDVTTGNPTVEKLGELGLDWLAEML